MGFFNEMMQALGTAAQTAAGAPSARSTTRRSSNDGLKKVAECTPCEMNAWLDSMRPEREQPKKRRRKR